MSNYNRTTFYIGVTGNIEQRIAEHKKGEGAKFSQKYKLKYLLYFEEHPDMDQAINREKQLKNWHRDWKINLIKSINPSMRDLSSDLHI